MPFLYFWIKGYWGGFAAPVSLYPKKDFWDHAFVSPAGRNKSMILDNQVPCCRRLFRRPGITQLQRVDIDNQRDQQDDTAHPQAHIDIELELIEAIAQHAEDQ